MEEDKEFHSSQENLTDYEIDKDIDERVEYLKSRMFEEKEFRCVKCLKVFHVAGRSLWAPYTCPDCSSQNK